MTDPHPRTPRLSWWGGLFFLGALGLLLALLSHVGWGSIGEALLRVTAGQLAVILAFGFLENIADATALRMAMQPAPSLPRLLATNGVGSLVNMLLPWDLGEVAKVALLRDAASGTAGVVIWNLAFKLSRPLGLLVFIAPSFFGPSAAAPSTVLVITGLTLLTFAPYVALRWLIHRGAATTIVRLAARFPRTRRLEESLLHRSERFDREVSQVVRAKPRLYRAIVAVQILARLGNGLAFWAVASALAPSMTWVTVALLYAAMSVTDLLILTLPSRIGMAEAAAFVIFPLVGFPAELGVIVSLIVRLKGIATNGLAAPFALLVRR